MKNKFGAMIAFGLAAALAAPSALGQTTNRQIVTAVTPLSETVTYNASEVDRPYVVGYKVVVTNEGINTVNNVRFVGTTVVLDSLVAPFKQAEGISCNPLTNAGETIECQLGTFPGGQGASLTFNVFFYSPVNLDTTSRTLSFETKTYYSEGATDSENASGPDTYYFTASPVGLGTISSAEIKSALTPAGGVFFTGKKGIPQKGSDAFTTTIEVPPTSVSTYKSTSILESATPIASCASIPNGCKYESNVSVLNKDDQPQRFTPIIQSGDDPLKKYLVIILRRDASDFKGSIGNTVVYYEGYPIDPCANDPDPIPASWERCVYDRKVFKRSDPEVKVDPELLGDAQIRILAKENGRLSW